MLDEALLDDPESLARADSRGMLRALATAGARVRTAARLADEAGLATLRPDGRPRAVLVAGESTEAGHVGALLAALSGGSCPVLAVRPSAGEDANPYWALPGWVGHLDLLLVASSGGTEQGPALLVEQAYQRGCTVVSVAPPNSPLAESTQRARGLTLPFAPPPIGDFEPPSSDIRITPTGTGHGPVSGGTWVEDVGALWALLVPLLGLADRIGLVTAPVSAVQAAANRLDETAAACGPATATYQNPAKTLAAELAESVPLLWCEGQCAEAVGRRFAACLAERAGVPALPAALPDALTLHRGLLTGPFSGGDDTEDFFRDRVEEPQSIGLRVVLLREYRPQTAASDTTPAHRLAHEHGIVISEVAASAGTRLEGMAQLIALTDFASVYLALAD